MEAEAVEFGLAEAIVEDQPAVIAQASPSLSTAEMWAVELEVVRPAIPAARTSSSNR